jgi:hypothetical protein
MIICFTTESEGTSEVDLFPPEQEIIKRKRRENNQFFREGRNAKGFLILGYFNASL